MSLQELCLTWDKGSIYLCESVNYQKIISIPIGKQVKASDFIPTDQVKAPCKVIFIVINLR